METISIDVLTERVDNLSKKVGEQALTQKAAVEAALTAIGVAKVDNERTVSVAFAASQSAINKTEESQKESNRAIGTLQNDVVSLKESRSQNVGDKSATSTSKEHSNFNINLAVIIFFNVLMFIAMIWKMVGH